ncbi:RNA 2',3'-cyclic phosphodiesterase [Photobacterium sp. ZSDE20]|uniref:RNA 2',3'-cyclic phosphodiesterase n=1 Tax=Photobacterium pectinilyticum TaxID=2906793 RepID=A0ABT1MXP1_9GAMM|nr:RNA 2',3'-cyclic phosphodiesterase [Photobacterium sp. ZSDE20]MCQ1057238.1 RNA 2',3'-cyclic phosphodiesterase [Photobacterium sp. ZSDE20]
MYLNPMKEKKQRLFFALAPDRNGEAFRRLAHLSSDCGQFGRPVSEDNLHITLAFLGMVTAEQADAVVAATEQLRPPQAFSLQLNTLGYWKRSKVIWIAPEQPPRALLSLALQLKALALDCGLEQESRPYRPHVTLAKSVARRPESLPAFDKIDFHFNHFGLYISKPVSHNGHQSVQYLRLGQWPLASRYQ